MRSTSQESYLSGYRLGEEHTQTTRKLGVLGVKPKGLMKGEE